MSIATLSEIREYEAMAKKRREGITAFMNAYASGPSDDGLGASPEESESEKSSEPNSEEDKSESDEPEGEENDEDETEPNLGNLDNKMQEILQQLQMNAENAKQQTELLDNLSTLLEQNSEKVHDQTTTMERIDQQLYALQFQIQGIQRKIQQSVSDLSFPTPIFPSNSDEVKDPTDELDLDEGDEEKKTSPPNSAPNVDGQPQSQFPQAPPALTPQNKKETPLYKEFMFDYVRLMDVTNPWSKIPNQDLTTRPGVFKESITDSDTKQIMKTLLQQMKLFRAALNLSNLLRNRKIYTTVDAFCAVNTGLSRTALRTDDKNPVFKKSITVIRKDEKHEDLKVLNINTESTNTNPITVELKEFDFDSWQGNSDFKTIYTVVVPNDKFSFQKDKIMRAFHGVQNVLIVTESEYNDQNHLNLRIASFLHTKWFHYKKYSARSCYNSFKDDIIDGKLDVSELIDKIKKSENTKSKNIFKKLWFPYPVGTGLVEGQSLIQKTIPRRTDLPTQHTEGIQIIYPWVVRDLFYTLACGIGTHYYCIANALGRGIEELTKLQSDQKQIINSIKNDALKSVIVTDNLQQHPLNILLKLFKKESNQDS